MIIDDGKYTINNNKYFLIRFDAYWCTIMALLHTTLASFQFTMLKNAVFRILFITPCLCCLVLSKSKPVTKVELTKHTSSLFLFWY